MRWKTKAWFGAIPFVLACLLLAGPARAVELYQVSTIATLLAGGYAGEATFAEVARHGDFGLGTVTGLDGEMVALDGGFYQVKSDGTVHVLTPEETTPFAEVVFFKGALDLGPVDGLDLAGLKKTLAARLPDPNRFYAVRVSADCAAVTTRSAPAQHKPWPPLAEAIKEQVEFPLKNIRGTLVGIYAPAGTPLLAPAGWHFHFLSDDRTKGGHLLAVAVVRGAARADVMDVVTVAFPKQSVRPVTAAPAPGTE